MTHPYLTDWRGADLSSDPKVRIVAMDELSGRYLRAQNLTGELA